MVAPKVPLEVVVYDEPEDCAYLPGRVARKPLRMPLRPLRPVEFSKRLREGDRRFGKFLYGNRCPECQACEAIRLRVLEFEPSRSQRRAYRKGQKRISVEIGPVMVCPERVRLFNLHEHGRGLARSERLMDEARYRMFLGQTCVDSFELRYRIEDKLVGVGLVDRAADSLSAVYTYYDPDYSKDSIGVFSIMWQWELCKRWGLPYLYLGYYIADCPAMAYKARYLPHERRIGGRWVYFERGDG